MPRWEEQLDFRAGAVIDLSDRAGQFEPHPMQMCVMPVVTIAERDGHQVLVRAHGTGFCIGPGLLVTAKHVAEDVIATLEVGMTVHAIYLRARTPTIEPWGAGLPIRMAHVNVATDLAVLEFITPRPDAFFWRPRLTFKDPVPGTAVLAFGYPEMIVTSGGLTLNCRLKVSQGVVGEVRHQPLEPGFPFSSFPAMESDFPSPGGMSGGPVLTTDGCVVAVTSSSFEMLNDDNTMKWCSTAALLYLLLAFEVGCPTGDGGSRRASINELAWDGKIETDGSHADFRVGRNPDGGFRFKRQARGAGSRTK